MNYINHNLTLINNYILKHNLEINKVYYKQQYIPSP